MKTPYTNKVPLYGSAKSTPPGKKMARIDKTQIINITIKLRPCQPLPNLLDPAVYRDFKPVTREEFGQRYGSTQEDIQAVRTFATHAGLSVVRAEPAKKAVELRGTVMQMEKAFGVTLSHYKHAGVTFRGRKGEIKIPKELEGIIEGIFGLDNRPVATPKFKVLAPGKTGKKGGKPRAAAAQAAFFPTDIASLYNFPPQADGKGQTIALIELGGGFKTADISNYFSQMGLAAPNVVAVSVDGGHNQPDGADGADGEVMLDIEVAGGIAPGATIAVYFAGNDNKSFLDAINQAIHDTTFKPSVLSISWGSSEGASGGWTASSLNAFNQAFQAAAMLGVTVCAASGDNGSNDDVNDGKVHVDFPSSSPYVLACGGTLLSTNNKKIITGEVVWHESDGGATGGGVSDVFPLPDYQSKAGVDLSLNSGKPGRGVPDLAGDADPNSGYNVLVDGKTMQIGGTSGVAPMMAGLLARINEIRGSQVGFIHPKLYANRTVCRDITSGDNITTKSKKGYSARPGWDACTGNGVPDGIKLLNIL
ncbi:MAG: S53 family peptidase [Bacteroidota bacterium]|nr:S53 family peptidase [Bacteroidota bacterium]MDP4253493.1 S53 family peptidase [Bacteroidota bacterium]MDP4260759.1 S53 family peptidase [Bacteroidota bacterium]